MERRRAGVSTRRINGEVEEDEDGWMYARMGGMVRGGGEGLGAETREAKAGLGDLGMERTLLVWVELMLRRSISSSSREPLW